MPTKLTRGHDLLCRPFAGTTKYQGSFRTNGARPYIVLPRNIRRTETLTGFNIRSNAILNNDT